MESGYAVRILQHSTGEKSPLLFERASGLPDIFANEWKLTRRPDTRSHLTLRQELLSIAFFYDFAAERGIDLHKSFANGRGLTSAAIASLKEACWRNRSRVVKSAETAAPVADGVHKFRIDTIRKFCVWRLNRELESGTGHTAVSDRREALIIYHANRHEKEMHSFASDSQPRRALSENQVEALFDFITPKSEINPFQHRFRLRNFLIVSILFHFGLRRGELLLLTTSDVDYRTKNPRISVKRIPDSRFDRRDDVAVKTRERHMPLSDDFAYLLRRYIRIERATLPNAIKTPFLFLGAHGNPLGTDGFQNIFKVIKNRLPILSGTTAHCLRNTWAENLRKIASKRVSDNVIQGELANLSINYLGGWTHQSRMSERYSRALIEELANDMHLESMDRNEKRFKESSINSL